jgi:hypothetical protein
MALLQGSVQVPGSNAIGSTPFVPSGKQGDLMVSELHGKWYQAAYAGKVFHGSSAITGIAVPLYTATTQALCLWNQSNTVNLELIKFSLGYVSGTEVAGPIAYGMLFAGTAPATAAPIATFTPAPTYVRPAMAGNGVSQAALANVTVTTTAAIPVGNIIASSISGTAYAAATSTAAPSVLEEQFDGSIIIPPGWAIFPLALLATVTLWTQRFVWAEWPA